MESECSELRLELSSCRNSLKICRKKLREERNKLRKVVVAVAERLEWSNQEIHKLEEEKQQQLMSLSSQLLNLQGSLMREKERVLAMVLEKDRIIDNQRKEIESLKCQINTRVVVGPDKLSSTPFTPPSSGISSNFSRSADNLDRCPPKPPVPSRDAVNRKLQIVGSAPPPPPPRGDSLKTKPNLISCDISNHKTKTRKLAATLPTEDITDMEDSGSKNEDRFDSGRESDETFESESVQSEYTDFSSSPQSELTPTPPQHMSTAPATDRSLFEEKVLRMDNKTKVTFWTDTYL